MRLRFSHRELFILSSLSSLATALPFIPFSQHTQRDSNLVARASYSVVPVDGGAQGAASGIALTSPEATVTVLHTVVQTASAEPGTLTVVSTETDIVPAGTTTISGSNTVETSILTIFPPAVTVVSKEIDTETVSATTERNTVETSILTVEQPGPTVIAPAPEASTVYIATVVTSSSAASSTTASSTSLLSTIPSAPSWSSTRISSLSMTISTSSTTSTSTSLSSLQSPLSSFTTSTKSATTDAVAEVPTRSSTSYDDGMWHTTYPVWSNSTSPTHLPRKQ